MNLFLERRDNFLKKILSNFPKIDFAVGYGSGVIFQAGNSSDRMIDMIFVVNDLCEFHDENFKLNPSHYKGEFKRTTAEQKMGNFAAQPKFFSAVFFH